VVHLARTTPLLIAISLALSGCGSSTTDKSSVPAVKGSSAVDVDLEVSNRMKPSVLRTYLRAWQAIWWRRFRDLERGGDDNAPVFGATADASWDRMQQRYGEAAFAFRRSERRLAAISPPSGMRPAHDAYMAAVRRQATRLQKVSEAFAGTDPGALNRALEALQRSQMQFDLDGAQWERSVIAACKVTGVEVPMIVRREYLSNGQRTR